MKEPKINHENPKVKVSTCQECNGWVRTAIVHQMTKKSKANFSNEILQHNLAVSEMTLSEYQDANIQRCECKSLLSLLQKPN